VGLLAKAAREDADELAVMSGPYELLNELLADAGMAPHLEPRDIPDDQLYDVQMLGYDGLHAVRRLAAYHACENRLPPPGRCDSYADDPMIERLDQALLRSVTGRSGGFLRRWLTGRTPLPKFQHLLWHSDCEGFYLPRDFEHVVLDDATPQREGIGGMVGSSYRLLQECKELAALISLPDDMDPEDEELWANADNSPADGLPWQIYGVEAFGLVRLIRGCELSIKHEAALVFG
jgi:hypothetical protein